MLDVTGAARVSSFVRHTCHDASGNPGVVWTVLDGDGFALAWIGHHSWLWPIPDSVHQIKRRGTCRRLRGNGSVRCPGPDLRVRIPHAFCQAEMACSIQGEVLVCRGPCADLLGDIFRGLCRSQRRIRLSGGTQGLGILMRSNLRYFHLPNHTCQPRPGDQPALGRGPSARRDRKHGELHLAGYPHTMSRHAEVSMHNFAASTRRHCCSPRMT